MNEEPARAIPARRILVVDDETNLVWSLARTLQAKGYHVTTAESAESALESLTSGHFDLVITDIRMPGMDGFELVEWLREHRPHISVVMTTAFGSGQIREKSMRAGALTYLEKPMDLNALTDFLSRLFNAPRFNGRVSDIDLLDYLQLISTTRKTKTLLITNRQDVGRMVFRDGQIIHAECGDLVGLDAFNEIMYWEGGVFTDVPFVPPVRPTIDENTSYLLMESARLRDERTFERENSLQGKVGVSDISSPGHTPVPTQAPKEKGSSGQVRYRDILGNLAKSVPIAGALLISREGLTLAREGSLPPGSESVLVALADGFERTGDALNLGTSDEGTVRLTDGRTFVVAMVGKYLFGAWIGPGLKPQTVIQWVRRHTADLE